MGGASSSARNRNQEQKDKKGRREGGEESGEDRKTPRPVVPRLDLTYAVSLAQGHRPYQEDRTAVAHPCPCPERKEDRAISFFAVYDGHAGTWTADYLVSNLHHVIARQKEYAGPNKLDAIAKGFQECDAQVLEEGGKRRDGSGATAVVAIVDREAVYVGNCGDSRCVIYRSEKRASAAGNPKLQLPVPVPVPGAVPTSEPEKDKEREREREKERGSGSEAPGEVEVLTMDHKPTDEAETKRIHAAGGLVHNKYIELHGRGLAVSRALGDAFFKSQGGRSALEQAVIALPHTRSVPRTRYDQFLILASDGLWNVMTEKEACALVLAERKRLRDEATDFGRKESSATDKEILEEVAAALTQRALDLKSKDNIACVLVEFRYSPAHGDRTLPKDA